MEWSKEKKTYISLSFLSTKRKAKQKADHKKIFKSIINHRRMLSIQQLNTLKKSDFIKTTIASYSTNFSNYSEYLQLILITKHM